MGYGDVFPFGIYRSKSAIETLQQGLKMFKVVKYIRS